MFPPDTERGWVGLPLLVDWNTSVLFLVCLFTVDKIFRDFLNFMNPSWNVKVCKRNFVKTFSSAISSWISDFLISLSGSITLILKDFFDSSTEIFCFPSDIIRDSVLEFPFNMGLFLPDAEGGLPKKKCKDTWEENLHTHRQTQGTTAHTDTHTHRDKEMQFLC